MAKGSTVHASVRNNAEHRSVAAFRRETLTTKNRDSLLFQAGPTSCDDIRIERVDLAKRSLREMMLKVGIEKSETGKDTGRRGDNNFFQ